MNEKIDDTLNLITPVYGTEEPIIEVLNQIPYHDLKEYFDSINLTVVYTPKNKKKDLIIDFEKPDFVSLDIIKEPKRGYGIAYITGFNSVEKGIIVTFDADGTYPVDKIPFFVENLNSNSLEFININRLKNYEKGSFSIRNIIGNRIITLLTNILFFTKIRDSQSGMWIFNSDLLKKLDLNSKGMEFSTEIKLEAWKKSAGFKELSGLYQKRIDNTKPILNPWKDGLRIVFYLIKRRFTLT